MADGGVAEGRAGTGVGGLDEVLDGDLVRDRLYLVEGTSGAGKTTLAMQFLIEDVRRGEKGLYLTLAETADELHAFAASHDWALPENLEIRELLSPDSLLDDGQQSLLYSSDLELGQLIAEVRRRHPGLPVLLATGYADLPRNAADAPPRLAKPYSRQQIRDEVDRLLGAG